MLSFTFMLLCVCLSKALGCPNGWMSHSESCYHFSHDKEAWPNAVTICQILGGHLVEINDATENNYLISQAKLIGTNFWIGLNDLQEEGTWVWVNSNTPLTQGTFANWSHGQPDNAKSNENCADLADTLSYMWNDAPCSILFNYICEKSIENTEIIG